MTGLDRPLPIAARLNGKVGSPRRLSRLTLADVKPASAITLAAGELAVLARTLTSGTHLPIQFICGTANHAGAALAHSDLSALAADHFCGVRDGSATRA